MALCRGLAVSLGLLAACGGGGGGTGQGAFRVVSVSVPNGARWSINRPIDLRFDRAVDLATVSFNTIQVVDTGGYSATGVFEAGRNGTLDDPTVVRFRPRCPTREDLADAGLAPGREYTLTVVGGSAGVGLRSTAGDLLLEGRVVTFRTPPSGAPDLFQDTVAGAPKVRLRGRAGVASDELAATHLELGGDPSQRVYFEYDPLTQSGTLPAGFEVPLNLYSVAEARVAVVLHLDQPVRATAANVDSESVRFEYEPPGAPGFWFPLLTEVELLENCSETGAALRVAPRGVLPQGSHLRVNLRQGFADLAGDETVLDQTRFAEMTTGIADHPGTSDPGLEADEVLERFLVGGPGSDSLEDTEATFATPPARWGAGQLSAAFDFSGNGGPGGNFDWHLAPGQTVVVHTTSSSIVGGPGGVPTTTQTVVGGVVQVRDLVVGPGAKLVAIGPNPLTILAAGSVHVDGEISLQGGDNRGVLTLNTTNLPEFGAPGNAGGGNGGTASYLTSHSTPRGGRGFGAFQLPGGGGEGGETGYAPDAPHKRRGGGGGGGRLGADVRYPYAGLFPRCQTLIGMDAEPGAPGAIEGLGAQSQSQRAQGGAIGPAPFLDEDPENDFLGLLLVDVGTPQERLVRGELDRIWAGAGGGGGGDAVDSEIFPLIPFQIGGDEKGGGGGGGGGALRLYALGDVVVGPTGRITADGGHGGPGENTLQVDNIGAGGGGGSGGHIVISSAGAIVVEAAADGSGAWYADEYEPGDTVGHLPRALSALGGQGGAGRKNRGGAKPGGPTKWRCDAIPLAYFEGTDAPPWNDVCFQNLPNLDDEIAPVHGAGGDGSPGVIQLHVADPARDLRFPLLQDASGSPAYGAGLDVTPAIVPPPLGWHAPDAPADQALPFFGPRSTAQSRWIPLGLARLRPEGGVDPVHFRFGGTDADGFVQASGTHVVLDPPLIGPAPLAVAPATPRIATAGTTMVLDAAPLRPDHELYLRNPALLRRFGVKLFEAGAEATHFREWPVAQASFDAGADELALVVEGGGLDTFGAAGTVLVQLVPRHFQVATAASVDTLPSDATIRIRFDATRAGPDGLPSDAAAHGLTERIEDLDLESWDFLRFRVEFDLRADGGPIEPTAARPALTFLRVPFEF